MTVLRRALAALLAVVLGAGIAWTVYQVSVQPGAAVVKAVFEAGSEVTPPQDFTATEAAVTEHPPVIIQAQDAPDSSIVVYTPDDPAAVGPLPVILWIHGGGFISSSVATVRDYAIMLAHEGYVVASLDYTLAPGAVHPAPVMQAHAALGYLIEHAVDFGGDPARVVLGGDSAGAQIASEVAAAETSPSLAASLGLEHVVALRGVVLFCGLYDMSTVGETGFPALRTYLWAYTGVREWTDYREIDELSTTRQATADYPSTFITVGDADPFQPQAVELAKTLEQHGVTVDTLFWDGTGDGLGHEYQFDFTLPQADEAFTRTLAFLSTMTEG